MSTAMIEAAAAYNKLGWIVHPLHSPHDKCTSPGKQPILNNWADLSEPLPDIAKYMNNGQNIGVVCGRGSNLTVIDFDDDNFHDWLITGINTSDWLMSSRTKGRGHIFFKHDPELKQRMSKKFSKEVALLGIDILSDNEKGGGSNVVIPPSVHISGDVYKFNRDPVNVPVMPAEFKERLLALVRDEEELYTTVKKCRKWVKDFFSNPDILHGGDGRRCMVALTAELKANGLSDRGVHFAAKIVYRQDYDRKRTDSELSHVNSVPWKSETLINNFPEYCNTGNTGGRVPEQITETKPEDDSRPEDIIEALKTWKVPEDAIGKGNEAATYIKYAFASVRLDDLPIYNEFVLTDVKEHFGFSTVDSIKKIWATYTTSRKDALKNAKAAASRPNYNRNNAAEEEEEEPEADTKQHDEEHISEEDKAKAKAEALEVLKSGNPMKYICETVADIHIGDNRAVEGLTLAIASQSCLNTQGLQIKMSGESGGGKSHLCKSVTHCLRDKHLIESSLSAKAAYYMKIEAGTIIFSDDTEISEDMETVIKRATTNYQDVTTHTTVKDGNSMTLTIPPRILWLITSVEDNVSDQLLNRQLIYNVDESEEQKKKIFEMQKREALEGEIKTLHVNHRVMVCREMWDIIKSKLFKVRLPYADDIDTVDKSNSRNFPMFIDMVRAYAVLNFMQRETNEEGYLLATTDDFYAAKSLFESQTDGILSKLNDKERKIVAAIGQTKSMGATINMIAAFTGYSYDTVRNAIKGRANKPGGLLEKYKPLRFMEETESESTKDDNGTTTTTKKQDRFILDGANVWDIFDNGFVFLKSDKKRA